MTTAERTIERQLEERIIGGDPLCTTEILVSSDITYGSIEMMAMPALAQTASIGLDFFDRFWASYQYTAEVKKNQKDNLRKLFLEMAENCQIMVPVRKEAGIFKILPVNLEIVRGILEGTKGISEHELHINELDKAFKERKKVSEQSSYPSKPVDSKMNHVYIGLCNPFVLWMMKLRESEELSKIVNISQLLWPEQIRLAYRFKKIGDQWGIVKTNGWDKEVGLPYLPEFAAGIKRYTKDYLMLCKLPSIFADSSTSNTDYVVAGIHRHGSEGISLLLKNEAIIEDIVRKVNPSRYFQAVFEVRSKKLEKAAFEDWMIRLRNKLKFTHFIDHKYQADMVANEIKLIEALPLE